GPDPAAVLGCAVTASRSLLPHLGQAFTHPSQAMISIPALHPTGPARRLCVLRGLPRGAAYRVKTVPDLMHLPGRRTTMKRRLLTSVGLSLAVGRAIVVSGPTWRRVVFGYLTG